MAYWTIIGKGIGDVDDKSFGLNLDTSAKKWSVSGPNVDVFFTSRSGDFRIVGAPEHGTRLAAAGGGEAAFLTNLDGTTAVGATGNGRASEKGELFSWKLDSK